MISSADLSGKMKNLLLDVTPNFEENLKRAFTNEGVRLHDRDNQPIPLDDVFITTEGTQIELRSLKLTRRPDFRISHMGADLSSFSLDWLLNVGTLKVEGEYEANNKSLQKLLPVSHNGKIVFLIENVMCQGIVGLYIREDSFCVENYDMKYMPSDVLIRVSYYERGEEIENETLEPDIDATLAKTFWTELTDKITQLFHRQLEAVIVEYSIQEMLIDEDDELKKFSKQQSLKANRLLDTVLCDAKTFLVNSNKRSFDTPSLSKTFKKPPPNDNQGSLQTQAGCVQDLSTLTRIKDFSLYEDKERYTIFGHIMLKDFKFGYEKYSSEWMGTVSMGSIRTTVYRNKIFLRISVAKGKDQGEAQLDQVQVRTVEDIDMDVSGLGSLSWVNSRLRSWVIGHLRYKVLPILEEKIGEAFKHALKNKDCKSLL